MAKIGVKSTKTEPLIYVIAGKEPAMVNNQYEQLIDQLLEPSQRMTGLYIADTDKISASDIFDELRTLPFLSSKRVVVIKNADDFIKHNRDLLEKYFDEPSRTGILVMTVESFPSNTILARKIGAFGKLISLSEPKSYELPAKLKQYAKDSYGKILSGDAAEFLIVLAGENLGKLYSEIDKLALYAYNEKTINTQHIENLIGKGRIHNIFNSIDAAIAGNVSDAVLKLREVFEQDKNSQFTFVGAFAYHLRRMFNAKVMLESGISEQQIIKNLKIWYGKEAFLAQIRKVSIFRIGKLISELSRIDYEIKTGRTSPQTAGEQFLFKLAFH
ncbi:MAG: DNA polymerase III subunit delta [Phycisphaerae bacterium]